MPKRKAPPNANGSNEKIGVPGGSSLTIGTLKAAQKPANAILDNYERTETKRIESAATVARKRWPNATERIDHWCETQLDFLNDTLKGLRDSLRAFSDRTDEGAEFRARFFDMTPLDIDNYLMAHTIDSAWLAGFSGDPALMRHLRSIAKKPRPKARRSRKWGQDVHETAQKFYDRAMKDYRSDPARFWRWKDFAPKCAAAVKQATGVTVTEEQLKRYILPARQYERPK